jgi:hypothetical protein
MRVALSAHAGKGCKGFFIHRGWLAAYDNGEAKSRAGIQIHASSHPKD